MTNATPSEDDYVRALEAIDTEIHHLLTDLKAASELDAPLRQETIKALRQARSELDPALLAFRQREDDTADTDSLILQWTPTDAPPRRLIIDPNYDTEGYNRHLLEWDGLGWRPRTREAVDDVAIDAPTAAQRPNPTDPPLLETLCDRIRGTWGQLDPLVLVFAATATTELAVVVDIDGELRYREHNDEQWQPITTDELHHALTERGQPTLTLLSETPLEREHFTDNSGTDPIDPKSP